MLLQGMAASCSSLPASHSAFLSPASLRNCASHSHRFSIRFVHAAPFKYFNQLTSLSWLPTALPSVGTLHARCAVPSDAGGDKNEDTSAELKLHLEDEAQERFVKLDTVAVGTECSDQESGGQAARDDYLESGRGNEKQCSSDAEADLAKPPFDNSHRENRDQVKEPAFRLSLSQLLDEARVIPVLIIGDQNVRITGIQHDSRHVSPGDIFVCCAGYTTDGHDYLAEAAENGAIVVVASKQVSVQESVKAVVLVEETNSILSALSAAFYRAPSQKLSVVGITGTNGKTTTSYLLKSMYEAMDRKTGLLGTIAYYIGGKKLEAFNTTPDAVSLQRLMAAMVHNSTNVCIMEVSSHALALHRCNEVDFDIAVFTNLTRDHMDFHKTEQAYKEAKGQLFAKMTDPQRHVKVVNTDDQHAPYFVALGNPDVPVVTFSMENREADVCALEVKLCLFETE